MYRNVRVIPKQLLEQLYVENSGVLARWQSIFSVV